ncbi:MAG: hypothetical protein ACRCYO_11690 [Bacteroidia bacterium]
MPQIKDYIRTLEFLEREYNFATQQHELGQDHIRVCYERNKRRIDLIFKKNQTLIRTYILNTEKCIPSYKDNDVCLTSDGLDLISNTTTRNHRVYWGENRPDGVYQLTDEQQLKDLKDILLDNIELLVGNQWPDRSSLDKRYAEKMGFPITYGWKPDPQLKRIKNDLTFLFEYGYLIIYDHDDKPEYESFAWEKRVVYENRITNHTVLIEVDYRATNDFMCFRKNETWSTQEPLDIEKIKKMIRSS